MKKKKRIVVIILLTVFSLLIICFSLSFVLNYSNRKRELIASSLGVKHSGTVNWQNITITLPTNLYYTYRENGDEIQILDPNNIVNGSTLYIRRVKLGNLTGKDILEQTKQSNDTVLNSGEIDFKDQRSFFIEQRDTQGNMYIKRIYVFQKNIVIGVLGRSRESLCQFDQILEKMEFVMK
jgi:hypothetical protein